jgi:hypothetical protein
VSTGRYEGGIVLPVAVRDLPGAFDLGTMVAVDVSRNRRDTGYGVEVVHFVTLGHALVGDRTAFYLEYAGTAGIQTGQQDAASANGGVTYTPTRNLQFDGGIMADLSHPTSSYTLFARFALRT